MTNDELRAYVFKLLCEKYYGCVLTAADLVGKVKKVEYLPHFFHKLDRVSKMHDIHGKYIVHIFLSSAPNYTISYFTIWRLKLSLSIKNTLLRISRE